MKKKYIITSILVILCSLVVVFTAKKGNNKSNKTFQSIVWECSEIQTDSFKLKSIISDYRIVPLEYTDNSIIGNIDKVIVVDSLVFVMDSQVAAGIFVFDVRSGKFIRNIGDVGKGFGEYLRLYDMSIDSENRYIYVLCEKKRLLCYSFTGKCLSVKELPFLATNFEYLDDKFYFINEMPDENNLYITDCDFHILSSEFPNNVYGENYRRLIHPLQKTSDGMLYRRFLDQNIYMIDRDNNIYPLYTLNLGDDQLNIEMVKKMPRKQLKDLMSHEISHIKFYTDGKDYSMALFFIKNVPFISIYDKKKNIAKTYEYSMMKNDLMNLNFPLLEFVTSEKKFIAVLYNEDIEALIENNLFDNNTYEQNDNPMLCIF